MWEDDQIRIVTDTTNLNCGKKFGVAEIIEIRVTKAIVFIIFYFFYNLVDVNVIDVRKL